MITLKDTGFARGAITRFLRMFRVTRGRPLRDVVRDLYSQITEDDVLGRSAQLAYYYFFSIFPGFIFLSSLPGLLRPESALRENLMLHLASFLPPDAFSLLQQTFNGMNHDTGKLTFGILLALWSATAGMAATCDALNAVHNIEESRSYWNVRMRALILTLGTAFLLLCAFVVLFWGDRLIQALGFSALTWQLFLLIKLVQWCVALASLALIFAITYYWAPDTKNDKWRWITPGSAIGVILWVIAILALRIYFHFFNSYSVTYGSVGAVMVLLTWFYLAGLALLIGAEINAVLDKEAPQAPTAAETEQRQKPSSAA